MQLLTIKNLSRSLRFSPRSNLQVGSKQRFNPALDALNELLQHFTILLSQTIDRSAKSSCCDAAIFRFFESKLKKSFNF
jgi:hypothetical protein